LLRGTSTLRKRGGLRRLLARDVDGGATDASPRLLGVVDTGGAIADDPDVGGPIGVSRIRGTRSQGHSLLNVHQFVSLEDARRKIEAWRLDCIDPTVSSGI
jgi:hypothetical protein